MKYIVEFNNDYVCGWRVATDSETPNYIGELTDDDLYLLRGWYKLQNNIFVEDSVKKQEIINEEEKEAQKPTWQETLEAQTFYTAMMTDTLIETEV